jgi:hypothetical protein
MALKPLSQVKFPELINFDRQTLVDEIVYRMKQDPNWSSLYDGDLYQNASQVVMHFFGYLFEKNAHSSNKIVKENFLNQAFSERAIYDNLNQMRINAQQNKEATTTISGTINSGLLNDTLFIPKFLALPATNLNNQPITFELITKEEDGSYNYIDNIIIEPGNFLRDTFVLTAYSGVTFEIETPIEDETLENFTININQKDIIDNSIVLYYKDANGNMYKLLKTDTFLVEPYITTQTMTVFPDGVPHYITQYIENGMAKVKFGSKEFGGCFTQSHIDGSIVIFGRSGGGSSDNILAGNIQTTLNLTLYGDKTINVTFTNITSATGGADRETTDYIKAFGPLRYGRGTAIIDKPDAQAALQRYVIKHEIDTPEFSELQNNVPLLHAFHQIVPKRSFDDFIFPDVLESDTLETYLTKFLLSLGEFCNVQGTHNTKITNEFVTEFVHNDDGYNFSHILANNYPLSSTLTATAWDYKNQLKDHIVFEGNYPTSLSVASRDSQSHATVQTVNFSYLTLTNGVNNKIKFSFDGHPYIFDILLTTGNRSAYEIASDIQNGIVNLILNDPIANQLFFIYRSLIFCRSVLVNEETGESYITLQSPIMGLNSTVEIIANEYPQSANALYTLFGIEEKIYRAALETGLVFAPSNLFFYKTNEISFLINEDFFDINKSHAFSDYSYLDINQTFNTSVEDGPIVQFTLTEENPEDIVQIQEGSDIIVNIYADALETQLMDTIAFNNIQKSDTNAPTYYVTTPEYYKRDGDVANYDYVTGILKIQLMDGEVQTLYKQSFTSVSKIVVYQVNYNGSIWETVGSPSEWFPTTEWSQNILIQEGPIIIINIGDEIPAGFVEGNSYEVRIFKTENSTPIQMMALRYENIPSGTLGVPATTVVINTEDITLIGATHYYDPVDKTVTIITKDGDVDTELPPYYLPGYPVFDHFKITYVRKSYEYITIDYTPNPYVPEGEAKQYIDILQDKSKRLIGLENLIQTFNFTPFNFEILLKVDKNYSLPDAIVNAFDVVKKYYAYDNINYEHTIGTKITYDIIRSAINKELVNSGIKEITFISSNFMDDLDEETIANTYFFILDDNTINRIAALEVANSNIFGITDVFKVKIKAIKG